MRTNIPAFRLPANVLDEEIGYIVDMGVDLALEHARSTACGSCSIPKSSMRCSSAPARPKGKELELPGRHDSNRVHIGIAWLESVAFQHIDKIGERVLIIGVGNTAMDCCRTSLRLGAKDVKVMARKPRAVLQGLRLGARGRRAGEPCRSSSIARRRASWSRTASSRA